MEYSMAANDGLLHMPDQCSQSAGGALAVARIRSWLSPVANQANFTTLENYLQGGQWQFCDTGCCRHLCDWAWIPSEQL